MKYYISYIPIFVARIGSGASAFLVAKLASGGHIEAGLVLAAYPFLEAIGAFIAGRWSDVFGRKFTLVAGYTARSAAMLLLALAFYTHKSPVFEAVLNGIIGFTTAFILTASLTMATDLTEVRNRGLGMGGFEFINLSSYGVGYLVGALLYTVFQNAFAYLTIAVLTAGATPIFVKFLQETKPAATGKGAFLLTALPPSAIVLLPVWFALTTIIGLGIYAPRVLKVDKSTGVGGIVSKLGENLTVGLLFIGALGVLGLGAIVFGRLTDKWGRITVFRIGLIGGFIALIVLNAALFLGIDPIKAVALTAPLLFLTSAIGPSVLALIGDETAVQYRGTVMGIYSVVMGLGIGFGSLLAGVVAQIFSQAEILGLAVTAFAVYTATTLFHLGLYRIYKANRIANGLREVTRG